MTKKPRAACLASVLLVLAAGCGQAPSQHENAPEPLRVAPDSDPEAIRIARDVMAKMGGREAWDRTRYLHWVFFDTRSHYWDRLTGDIRIESPRVDAPGQERPAMLVLMNIHTLKGRVWKNHEVIRDPDELEQSLEQGHRWWVNDSYWMFMPYKLLDPGVRLKYAGERTMEDGRLADVLDLTFEPGIGDTPQNRYEVYVARDSGLVEQWSFFADADDQQPQFTMPWEHWKRFGGIMLATGRGRGSDWDVAVYDDLPTAVFRSDAPVAN